VKSDSRAASEEEAILPHLGEVNGRRRLTLFERTEALRRRRLTHVRRARHDPVDRRLADRGDRVLGLQAFFFEEPAGDRRDQRRVERRKARELDVDGFAHRSLLGGSG
jgi:hypothetical protein